jgi:hypothetical protein
VGVSFVNQYILCTLLLHKKPDSSTDQVLVDSSMAIMSIAVISHNMHLVYLNHISNCGIRASVLLVGNVRITKSRDATNMLK